MSASASDGNAPSAPARSPASVSLAEVDALLEALEPYASRRDTLTLHDPLYLLRQALKAGDDRGMAQALEALAQAVEAHADHPLIARFRMLIGAAPPERSLRTVLERFEALPEGADPLDELERRLARQRRERDILDTRIADLERQAEGTVRVANGTAAVGALVALVALLGWLAALGVWTIPWMDPPTPPDMTQGSQDAKGETTTSRR